MSLREGKKKAGGCIPPKQGGLATVEGAYDTVQSDFSGWITVDCLWCGFDTLGAAWQGCSLQHGERDAGYGVNTGSLGFSVQSRHALVQGV